jgi:hypothetical protein
VGRQGSAFLTFVFLSLFFFVSFGKVTSWGGEDVHMWRQIDSQVSSRPASRPFPLSNLFGYGMRICVLDQISHTTHTHTRPPHTHTPFMHPPNHSTGNFEGARRNPIRTGQEELDKRVVYSPHIYGPEVFSRHGYVSTPIVDIGGVYRCKCVCV